MGRPKKLESKEVKVEESESTPHPPSFAEVVSEGVIYPISLRDENELLRNVDYVFDKYGFVDWRKMVNPEHVILNKYRLADKGIDVNTITDEERTKLLAESGEEDLLIKLAGFKEVAKVRGYLSIESQLVDRNPESASVKVTINWLPNFETNFHKFEVSAVANASLLSTDFIYSKYLDTIAENRAFVRAVRNSLGIHVVGFDEIKNDEKVEVKAPSPKPQGALQKIMDDNKVSFDDLREIVTQEEYNWDDKWSKVSDIPPALAMNLFGLIKKKYSS